MKGSRQRLLGRHKSIVTRRTRTSGNNRREKSGGGGEVGQPVQQSTSRERRMGGRLIGKKIRSSYREKIYR